MRKAGLVLVMVLVAGVTWRVAMADPAKTVGLCIRAGTDVRSPSSNGSCPSGYTKVDVGIGASLDRSELLGSTIDADIFYSGVQQELNAFPASGVLSAPVVQGGTPGYAEVLTRERTFTSLQVDLRPTAGQILPGTMEITFRLGWQPPGGGPVLTGPLGCTLQVTTPTTSGRIGCTSDGISSITAQAGSLIWVIGVPSLPAQSPATTLEADVATSVF